jgi:predicted nucleotide-binding protein
VYRRNFSLCTVADFQKHENSEYVNTDMNYIEELARIKDEFGKLQVGNEAVLTGLRHDLLNVVTLAITNKQIADRYVKQVNSIWFHPQAIFIDDPWDGPSAGPDLRGPWNEGRAEMVAVIDSITNHLERFAIDTPPATVPQVAPRNKVFIVHGHDHGMLNAVEAFVRKIGVEAVVLRDEANRGGTVIEKFERYSDVPFAIILLSPDDEGRARSKPDDPLRPRPRQNAVAELGFFIGKLGRRNTTVVVDGNAGDNVEYPSDIAGVVYLAFRSDGAWKLDLMREFRAAEIVHDPSKA